MWRLLELRVSPLLQRYLLIVAELPSIRIKFKLLVRQVVSPRFAIVLQAEDSALARAVGSAGLPGLESTHIDIGWVCSCSVS